MTHKVIEALHHSLSEQHPREQGLKHQFINIVCNRIIIFQSNIQENKDWNRTHHNIPDLNRYFQSNIQENKDWNQLTLSGMPVSNTDFQSNIQENKDWNPSLVRAGRFGTIFQSNIQENKDWNSGYINLRSSRYGSFRATSKRTRIETPCRRGTVGSFHRPFRATSKRTRIETRYLEGISARCDAFRATSKRTRIETPFTHTTETDDILRFQSNIQENKDWNHPRFVKRRPGNSLSEQHPREQGLKHFVLYNRCFFSCFQSNIQENKDWNKVCWSWDTPTGSFQSNIQENKDWNNYI